MNQAPTCARCGFPLDHSAKGAGVCARCLARSIHGILCDESPSDQSHAAPLPREFGAYKLLEEIGRGGMGVVYRARQLTLDREVALKLLLAGSFSSEALLSRFRMEAAAAASLQHPNIVPVYDYGEWEGHPYYAMELVVGRNLAVMCAGRPLGARWAAEIVHALAAAVHVAHLKGVVHRDLKPSNVMIDETGRPRITDFGLARRLDGPGGATVTGQMLGSPSYASPEQATSTGEQVSAASDIYGLGALFYHLLTGRAPFNAPTPTETLKLVIETEPVRPRLLNPTLPRDAETICLKCLAKEPTRRYASAQALAEDIRSFLEQRPIRARPPSIAYRTTKLFRRRWPALSVAAVILALLSFGATAWARNLRAASAARERRGQIEHIFDRAMQVADPGFSRGRNATLKDLLEETARWVPIEFADDPLLEAAIHAKIGETYCKLSMFDEAAPHLEKAWATRQRLLPSDHPDYLHSLRQLGVLRTWQMRYAEAEDVFYRVLRTQERLLGVDSEAALQTRADLLDFRGMEEFFGLWRYHGAERDAYVQETRRLAQESYELAKHRLGDEHPLTLLHEGNAAYVLGNTDEAERTWARNFRTCARVLGPEHPTTLGSMVNWGIVLLGLKRNDEALQLLQEDLPIAERALGPDHQITAWTAQQLEQALRNVGRINEANDLIPRYLPAWLRTYGPSNLTNQAIAFWKMHRLATEFGQPDASARCAQDMLRELQDHFRVPPDHRAIGLMDLALADALLAQNRLPEAERHLRDAKKILLNEPVTLRGQLPVAWQLWYLYREFGAYHAKRKEFNLAEVEFFTALEGLSASQQWPFGLNVRAEVLTELVQLYTDWGQPAKAAEWRQKREAFLREHPEVPSGEKKNET